MALIYIVEDDENIREIEMFALKNAGYEVQGFDCAYAFYAKLKEKVPAMVLLDIMLPGKNGYEICKELRDEGNNTPIIMITAKTEELDKVMGLEYGADDYISKPFGIREMMARIKAVLRRYEVTSEMGSGGDTIISIDDLKINIERHEVKVGDRYVDLTLKEFELLRYLAENRGHVYTRDQLLNNVWGIDYAGETRTVDVHIRHLRQKLSAGKNDDQYIETVRGKGYKAR